MSNELLLDKPAPSSVEAERLILGVILLVNETVEQAVEEALKPEDFFQPSHRRIYERILHLYEQGHGIDPLTLQEELRRVGELEQVGGAHYISTLIEGRPYYQHIEEYVRIIKGKSRLRKLMHAGHQIVAQALDDEVEPDVQLEQAENLILSLADDSEQAQFHRIGDVAAQRREYIEAVKVSGTEVLGLSTGFADLDRMTAGLHEGDMVVVGARPRVGKTSWSCCLAERVAKSPLNNDPVIAYFSIEMPKEQITDRMICIMAGVDAQKYRKGALDGRQQEYVDAAISTLGQYRIEIDDSSYLTPALLMGRCKRLKKRYGRLDLVVIDYLQKMSAGATEKGLNEYQEVKRVSAGIKLVARQLKTRVVALAQLSRRVDERPNKRPVLADLRDSGKIEEDADVVMFLYREQVYNPNADNTAELIIEKQRMGPAGTVYQTFIPQSTRFEEQTRGVEF